MTEILQDWLDGIAGMVIWMKAHGKDPREVFQELANHDIPGIKDAIMDPSGPAAIFSPRSSSYWKYITELTTDECHERFHLERQ